MSTHEQYADDLALYALGSLTESEHGQLQTHVDECAACRRELQQLRGDMALLALSVGGAAPPRRARQRLLDAIAMEPARPHEIARSGRGWLAQLSWVFAAAFAIVAAFVWKQNSDLKQQVAQVQTQAGQQQAQLQQARDIVNTLTAGDAVHVTLVAAKSPPQPQGRAIYLRDRSSLIFIASNMPPLPPQKAYELWLIPDKGAPIPAGVFKPDSRGAATVVNPPLPAGVVAKAFAITVEPEQGSTTPTMPIMMMGSGA